MQSHNWNRIQQNMVENHVRLRSLGDADGQALNSIV